MSTQRAPLAWLPVALLIAALASGCAGSARPDLETEDYVDLERFMGNWYVIASIPTFIERDIYNAVERYELADDGRIETTFTFRRGGFDGKEKTLRPTGFVEDPVSNAIWGMQFLWPFRADYRIVHVDDDYRVTVIGRNKRDYAWIMAREPQIPPAQYQQLVALLATRGYDTSRLRQVPQRW